MNQTIVQAIKERRLMSVTYDGYKRTVEPLTYGLSKKGKETLSAYQLSGGHASEKNHDWPFFTVAKITALSILEDSFEANRRGYVKGDSRMIEIFCEL